jgi:hypothetical protein
MTTSHLTIDDLTRWHRGDVAGDEMLAMGSHLSTCDSCAALAAERFGGEASALALCEEIELGEHPDLERDLMPFVEGTPPGEQRSEKWPQIAAHLALCAFCRGTVDDLRALAVRPERRRSSRLAWLAAAGVAAVLLLLIFRPQRTIVPTTPTPRAAVARPSRVGAKPEGKAARAAEWQALVDAVKARGNVELPAALLALQVSPDEYRSTVAAPEPTAAGISPTQEIVESRRPAFTWPAGSDGATYVVTVVQGGRVVTRSGVLRTNHWRSDRALERGRTYSWQVEVAAGGDTVILPSPPAPSARFAVLDSRAADRLSRARATAADDPLVLGILFAEAGLLKDARRELAAVRRPDEVDLARQLMNRLNALPLK